MFLKLDHLTLINGFKRETRKEVMKPESCSSDCHFELYYFKSRLFQIILAFMMRFLLFLFFVITQNNDTLSQ